MANKNRKAWLIGSIVIAGSVVALSFLNVGQSVVYFYTPAEAKVQSAELAGKTIKIGAMVVPGSIEWNAENLDLRFMMSDNKGNDIKVMHKGTPPDMFKEGQGVVVEGRITAGGMEMKSHHLMVKHSEEYKKPDDHASMDKVLLEKSLFKNESVDQ